MSVDAQDRVPVPEFKESLRRELVRLHGRQGGETGGPRVRPGAGDVGAEAIGLALLPVDPSRTGGRSRPGPWRIRLAAAAAVAVVGGLVVTARLAADPEYQTATQATPGMSPASKGQGARVLRPAPALRVVRRVARNCPWSSRRRPASRGRGRAPAARTGTSP
jgi:hypothetical protein